MNRNSEYLATVAEKWLQHDEILVFTKLPITFKVYDMDFFPYFSDDGNHLSYCPVAA